MNEGARFSTTEEIKSVCVKEGIASKNFSIGGIPQLVEDGNIYLDSSDEHMLVVGSTRSKKSRLIALPQLYSCIHSGESAIVGDPKGEGYRMFSKELKEKGISTILINLINPEKSNNWNPMTLAQKYYNNGEFEQYDRAVASLAAALNAEERAKTNDVFWSDAAENLHKGAIKCLIEYANEAFHNLESVERFLNQAFGNDNNASRNRPSGPFSSSGNLIDSLFKVIGTNNEIANLLKIGAEAPDKTLASMLAVANAPLAKMTGSRTLNAMMSRSDFSVTDIAKQQTIVFLMIPDETDAYNMLVSIFIQQAYEELINYAKKNSTGSTPRLPIRVNFILDEFGSLPVIPNFMNKITAAAGYNIRFSIFIQDIGQLEKYGPGSVEAILSNAGILMYLKSRNMKFLNMLSDICGTYVDEETNMMIPLVSSALLQYLDKERGEVLIVRYDRFPFLSNLLDIGEYPIDIPDVTKYPTCYHGEEARIFFSLENLILDLQGKYENNDVLNYDKFDDYEDYPEDVLMEQSKMVEEAKRIKISSFDSRIKSSEKMMEMLFDKPFDITVDIEDIHKERLRSALKHRNINYDTLSPEWKNERKICLSIVIRQPEIYLQLSPQMKNEPLIAYAAFSNNPALYPYLCRKMRFHPTIVKMVLESGNVSLKDVPAIFRNDPEVAGYAKQLKGVSKALLNDEKFAIKMVKRNVNNVRFFNKNMRIMENDEILMELATQTDYYFDMVPEKYRSDRDFVYRAVKRNGLFLQYATKEIQEDKEFVKSCVIMSGMALSAPGAECFRDDKNVVLKAVANNGWALQYASERLRGDVEVVRMAILNETAGGCYLWEKNSKSLALYFSIELLDNKKIMVEASGDGRAFIIASPRLRKEKSFWMELIDTWHWSLDFWKFASRFAAVDMSNDKEILIRIKENENSDKYIIIPESKESDDSEEV